MANISQFYLEKQKYSDAECIYYERLSGSRIRRDSSPRKSHHRDHHHYHKDHQKEHHHHHNRSNRDRQRSGSSGNEGKKRDGLSSCNRLISEITQCRENILKSLQEGQSGLCSKQSSSDNHDRRIEKLESENQDMKKTITSLEEVVQKLESRVIKLENKAPGEEKIQNKLAKADDDELDLFGSDDDEDALDEERQKQLQAYNEKKSKKPQMVAKSSVVLDVKPWDDETDMAQLEKCVRSIEKDGLVWGASKLVPVAYNVKKLQIVCVVEDEKVGIEELSEEIQDFEDYVQSVDIAAFNKI